MKTSIQLMKLLSDDTQWKLAPEDLVVKIGSQLGEVKEVIDLRAKYDGIKVAQIVEVTPHPDADKLNIYQILAGGSQKIQVVSGDTSLSVGDKVAWLAPGATVPSTYGTEQAFVLSVRPLRGHMSHGMFGSGKELDFNDDAASVLKLDTKAEPGTAFAEAYNLDDVIIDIENKMFTHRPDCFGNLGVAREIAGIQGIAFESPDWYSADAKVRPAEHETVKIEVENNIPDLVSRYAAVALEVEIAPSPLWLQSYLRRLGIRPINNVVDITNYVMICTAQPLHAFDFNKVSGSKDKAKIVIRHPKKDEELILLDGKKVRPSEKSMLICNDVEPIALGGMMGGANSDISNNTKRIILESATFDMYQIRRSSMQMGIFTDAVTRFSKGQSPEQCLVVLAKAVEILIKFAGAKVISKVADEYPKKHTNKPIIVSSEFINSRLGSDFTADQIATTLRNVELIVEQSGDELVVTAPFWRRDIEIKEDIVEEVGRLIGYDKLPQSLPQRATSTADVAAIDLLKSKIRNILAGAGANELQTYSFVPAKLMQAVGQQSEHAFSIRNAISPDLQKYRLSITPGLLDKIHPNIKAGFNEFGLFEMNRVHIKGDDDCDGLPREYQTLAFAYAAKKPGQGAPYYVALKHLDYLLKNLNISYKIMPAATQPQWEIGRQVFAPFEPKRSGFIIVNDEFAGFIGEYKIATRKNLKLPDYCAGFEIDVERLLKHQKTSVYKKLLRFPSVEQDICFKVESKTTYGELLDLFTQALTVDAQLHVDVEFLDIYQREQEKSHKQITFRVNLQHPEKTLTNDEVSDLINNAIESVRSKIPAERV
ncbi:MAG TPA: phenylalanine--tRNA ligase subunit beta [Candidatus Saccharimonadales bacterium]|nr:phenylalanine--tRNA ligase subunit beta [Candidatus Saccharimonadales bacterium]